MMTSALELFVHMLGFAVAVIAYVMGDLQIIAIAILAMFAASGITRI